ncbi:uncharacterized protein LOC134821049 [Bolinopsis microptera]|uniref:uncharacterized protein LOC134821049 n=1 Tax=Bolinopsis microptera TaxID=2820187 RepID=UPI00307A6F07
MIEIEENVSLYMFASGRHTSELGILVMWLFFVLFLGTGSSVITALSWIRGILLGFNRNKFGAALILNLTMVDLLFLVLIVFPRGITVAADRWVFGWSGCGFFPLAEEYLTLTRTITFLVLSLYPVFCNMPSRNTAGIVRSGLLLAFIWCLGLIPLITSIASGFGMHIEYTSGYGGCAIHTTTDTNYRPSLILFSNLIVQGFLVVITTCSSIVLFRKRRLVQLPNEATAPPQTVSCWLCLGAILGLLPYILISLLCMLPGVEYADMSTKVNMFQLCWYYGSILLTPFILYWVDHNYNQYFRYLVLGKDAVDDKRVLAKVNDVWFSSKYNYSANSSGQLLAQVNDDLRMSVNFR